MIFFEQFNLLLRVFTLFGFKPNLTIAETNLQKSINFVRVIVPSVIYIIVTLYLANYPHLTSYGIISVLIYYASFLPSVLMILTANGQCFFYNSSYQIILNLIGKVESRFKEKKLRLSLQCVAFHYRLKMVLVYSLYFFSQGFLFFEVWFLDSPHVLSSVFISVIRATHPLQLFHFIVYSDIIGMLFHELNVEIRNSPTFVHLSSKIEFLKYVKLMHMDLWKLVGQINHFFGWNLLFTTMYVFIYITHQFYWIFLNTHDKLDLLGLFGIYKRHNKTKG